MLVRLTGSYRLSEDGPALPAGTLVALSAEEALWLVVTKVAVRADEYFNVWR